MKSKEKIFVTCKDCRNSYICQWFDNPMVCFCDKRMDWQVADTVRLCSQYRKSEKDISQRPIARLSSYEQDAEKISSRIREKLSKGIAVNH